MINHFADIVIFLPKPIGAMLFDGVTELYIEESRSELSWKSAEGFILGSLEMWSLKVAPHFCCQ